MTAHVRRPAPCRPAAQFAVEPRLDVAHVVDAVLYMASLPLDANVQFLTVMATKTSSTRAPNRTNRRCLHAAAHKGHLPAVELLLTRGLDVNSARGGTTPTRCTGPRPPVTRRRPPARRRGR